MGKLANVVRDRKCGNCEDTISTTSKGLKKHFKTCCAASKQPGKSNRKVTITKVVEPEVSAVASVMEALASEGVSA